MSLSHKRDALMSPEPDDSDSEVRSGAIFGIVVGAPTLAIGVAMVVSLPGVWDALPRSRALGRLVGYLAVLPLMLGSLFLSVGVFRLLHGSPHRYRDGLGAAFARGLTIMLLVIAGGVGALILLLSFINDLN